MKRLPFKKYVIDPYKGREDIYKNVPLFFYRNTFYSIVMVLEARDAYTAHHSERVAFMASRFCDLLRLPPLQKEMIDMTAAVHDIGKAGISDATLKKPGRLNDEEWEEIRQHPLIGAEIIRKAGQMPMVPEQLCASIPQVIRSTVPGSVLCSESRLDHVADAIAAHHERWDGGGYPMGLKGEEIPYASRIIALCDSVDAMRSKRVYRGAMPAETCKSELQRGRGVMYDPKLTDAFLAGWDYIVGDIYEELALIEGK